MLCLSSHKHMQYQMLHKWDIRYQNPVSLAGVLGFPRAGSLGQCLYIKCSN